VKSFEILQNLSTWNRVSPSTHGATEKKLELITGYYPISFFLVAWYVDGLILSIPKFSNNKMILVSYWVSELQLHSSPSVRCSINKKRKEVKSVEEEVHFIIRTDIHGKKKINQNKFLFQSYHKSKDKVGVKTNESIPIDRALGITRDNNNDNRNDLVSL
jgi:hypothetical protein